MKKSVIFLFVFLLGSCVFALDYNIYKLDDGQTVIIKQVKNNPIVTIDTWVRTGSINENDQNNGVSHFLEHLFFKGTEAHPTGEFDKILESKGAITNAATSKDFTHYYITIPSKDFDLAMELHSDMLLNPLIPRKELEKERKVVLEEIAKGENDPTQKVFDNLNQMLYKTHPYKRKVLGKGNIIGVISRDEILHYYYTHYGPQNMVTVIIGDISPEYALKVVKKDFKIAQRKLTCNINKPEKPLSSKTLKIDYQPVNSGYLIIAYRDANILNQDTYSLDVLATILGEGRSSILYQDIKEQKQLADSISADNSSFREDGIFSISAEFTPDKAEKLQKAIYEDIEKIRTQGVTEEQLNLAKEIIKKDTYYSRESVSNIASQIGYTTTLTGNPKYYDEYLDSIKKVTLSDIKNVANKYLNENKSAVSIVLPQEMKDVKITNQPDIIHSAKLVKETATTKKYLLDNEATLLISPNDLNDIIAISINVKGGNFLEKIPGTSDLVSSVMMKGTNKYSMVEFARIADENGIKISPSAGSDTFSIDVLTTKPKLTKTFELLDEVINSAKFDNYEIDKAKTDELNAIKSSRDVPMNVAIENYKNLIFENSVYSYGPQIYEKTLPTIQRKDILEYYNTIFNPKNIVISVDGNINKDDLVNQFSQIFPKKDNTLFDYNQYASKIYPLTSPKNVVSEIKDLKTAWLIIGWQTPGFQNQKDCATLKIIDSILGSGMSSRLFKDLRVQEGLAYQLGSSFSPKILKGSFTIFIGTNPKTLELSQKMILDEINKLKTEFVSDKELQEAKDKIIGNYIISQETNLDKASTIGWFETSGRGFDFQDKYEQLINSITASDIIEVANKYFNENDVTSIIKNK